MRYRVIAVLIAAFIYSSQLEGQAVSEPKKAEQAKKEASKPDKRVGSGTQIVRTDKKAPALPHKDGGNGINVGTLKVYDDRMLRSQLEIARARLATLQVIDAAGLTSRIGGLSGGRLDQSALAIGITGPGLPGVVTTQKSGNTTVDSATTLEQTRTRDLAADPPTDSTGSTFTRESGSSTTGPSLDSVTTQNAVSPTIPSMPSTGAGFALPSGFSVSSLDVLNEQLQLQSEIINYQLLLEGAVSDSIYYVERNTNNGEGRIAEPYYRQRATIGLPVWVSGDRRYKDAVAEIILEVVTTCPQKKQERPILVSVLPRERTYNVAALTERSTSIGTGVLIGAVNGGFNLLSGRKTFYVVKDQDTVAMELPVEQDPEGTVLRFGWRLRPVLGQRLVSSTPRQVFAQIAFATTSQMVEFGSVRVITRWRRHDPRIGAVSAEEIKDTQFATDGRMSVPNLNIRPVFQPDLQDLGDGNVVLTLTSSREFLPGTFVRVGPSIITTASAGATFYPDTITFSLPVATLARQRVSLVGRSGEETEVLWPSLAAPPNAKQVCSATPPKPDQQAVSNPTVPAPTLAPPAPVGDLAGSAAKPEPTGSNAQAATGANRCFEITGDPTFKTKSSGTSILTIPVKYGCDLSERKFPIAILGGKIYGFADAPLQSVPKDKEGAIELVVADEIAKAARVLEVRHVFGGQKYAASRQIEFKPAFSIDRITILSHTKTELVYAIAGNRLKELTGVERPSNGTLEGTSEITRFLTVTPDSIAGLKSFVFKRGEEDVVLHSIPTGDPPKKPVVTAQPALKVSDTEKTVEFSGSGLAAFDAVYYRGAKLTAQPPNEKKPTVSVTLPASLMSVAGTYLLEFAFKETEERIPVTLTIFDTKVSNTDQ